MQDIFLSVIIPAYNEALRISRTITAISEYLKTKSWEWEILVINDGSSDETKNVVKKFQSRIPCLKLISYQANKGKGYAVRAGMLGAKGRYRLFLDADYSVAITNWNKFSYYLNEYDVIIGSIEKQGGLRGRKRRVVQKNIGETFQSMRARANPARDFRLLQRV